MLEKTAIGRKSERKMDPCPPHSQAQLLNSWRGAKFIWRAVLIFNLGLGGKILNLTTLFCLSYYKFHAFLYRVLTFIGRKMCFHLILLSTVQKLYVCGWSMFYFWTLFLVGFGLVGVIILAQFSKSWWYVLNLLAYMKMKEFDLSSGLHFVVHIMYWMIN